MTNLDVSVKAIGVFDTVGMPHGLLVYQVVLFRLTVPRRIRYTACGLAHSGWNPASRIKRDGFL